ncbi:hypothetical protein Pan97_00770 [Bremerella volcania]|uniref:Uncharacterized protein n=1 Tax=Bremerella volcania TaxID=2527984 RepID=A0A518C1K8_9BACT|nr:hypothetical protein [Bremerella volcania]QDU73110.1 hypothetical protein Pan97_00770 [Bremerella volcania]
MSIPRWNKGGVLPPVDSNAPTAPERSPYKAQAGDFIHRFAVSAKRQQILRQWLDYRAALYEAGITKGFQWLDGSFLEEIELTEKRDPNDIDCVTFFQLGEGVTEESLVAEHPELFSRDFIKRKFNVDAYYVNQAWPGRSLIENSAYWYSLWSHRRDLSWKGFVQIELDLADDGIGKRILDSLDEEI